jgi:hypothetical protein
MEDSAKRRTVNFDVTRADAGFPGARNVRTCGEGTRGNTD